MATYDGSRKCPNCGNKYAHEHCDRQDYLCECNNCGFHEQSMLVRSQMTLKELNSLRRAYNDSLFDDESKLKMLKKTS